MKFVENKVYTAKCNGYDHSMAMDPILKGEKWVYQGTNVWEDKYIFTRVGGHASGKDRLLFRKAEVGNFFETEKNTFEVDAEFIKAGYASACSDWQRKIETKFPELFKSKAEALVAKVGTFRNPNDYKTVIVGERIFIPLPNSNNAWVLEAFEYAKKLVAEGDCYIYIDCDVRKIERPTGFIAPNFLLVVVG